MIRIIEPGLAGRAICDACKCIFTFEYEDIKFGNQKDPENFVDCPCCTNSIVIKMIPRRKDNLDGQRSNIKRNG